MRLGPELCQKNRRVPKSFPKVPGAAAVIAPGDIAPAVPTSAHSPLPPRKLDVFPRERANFSRRSSSGSRSHPSRCSASDPLYG
jgi:hypothetical protein